MSLSLFCVWWQGKSFVLLYCSPVRPEAWFFLMKRTEKAAETLEEELVCLLLLNRKNYHLPTGLHQQTVEQDKFHLSKQEAQTSSSWVCWKWQMPPTWIITQVPLWLLGPQAPNPCQSSAVRPQKIQGSFLWGRNSGDSASLSTQHGDQLLSPESGLDEGQLFNSVASFATLRGSTRLSSVPHHLWRKA